MAPTPAAAQIVRKSTDDRIGHSIYQQGNKNACAHEVVGQAENLAVEDQQQIGEAGFLCAIGDSTHPVIELGTQCGGGGRG